MVFELMEFLGSLVLWNVAARKDYGSFLIFYAFFWVLVEFYLLWGWIVMICNGWNTLNHLYSCMVGLSHIFSRFSISLYSGEKIIVAHCVAMAGTHLFFCGSVFSTIHLYFGFSSGSASMLCLLLFQF